MLKITDWAAEDRPREKMMARGAAALTNAELMALLIGSGSRGTSAVDLMRQVLADYDDSLRLLGRASVEELTRYRGMGQAKAVSVLAACQLAQRRLDEEARQRRIVRSSRDIYELFLPAMQDLQVEECRLLLMKQNCSVVGTVLLSRGGMTETAVDVRLVVKHALLADATVVALCHNHPSGSLRPSRFDDELTRRALRACQLMNLRLLDHVILTDGAYYSYADEGRLGE